MGKHILSKLAKNSVERYLKDKEYLKYKKLELPDWSLNTKAGVFVTIYQKGQLRGCIGTPIPIRSCVAQEIISNAVAAALEDPRFFPVTQKELDYLDFEISVLSEPELIKSKKELDSKKFGVIIKTKDGRSGLLLPDIPGITDYKDQIQIAAEKGGIYPDEDYDIYKFSVKKYT